MNTLTLLKTPNKLTQSKFRFNRAYFDHVRLEVNGNILTFEGYVIVSGDAWGYILRRAEHLNKIEERFIKTFYERHGFCWLKKRKFYGVTGEYVLKERIYKKYTTNVWTIINKTGDNHDWERITNQE